MKQYFRISNAELKNFGPVKLPYPDRRARKLAKMALVLLLIILTVLGSIGTWLPGILQVFGDLFSSPATQDSQPCAGLWSTGSTTLPSLTCSTTPGNSPVFAGVDGVPNISLKRTILSSVDRFAGAGGAIKTSKDDFTLYNSAISMRLLGGPSPHDELLGRDHRMLSSWSFWGVEANISDSWIPLVPSSTSLTLLGTNQTGTFVLRSMQVAVGNYSGTLRIAYKATIAGPLKWDLDFKPLTAGQYRFVYTWKDLSNVSSHLPDNRTLLVGYGNSNYILSWNDVPQTLNVTTRRFASSFTLSINLGYLAGNSHVTLDPSIVSSTYYSTPGGAVDYQFQRKTFQDSKGRYFVFYYDGYSEYYASSLDGSSWNAKQAMPAGWPGFVDGPTSLPSVAYYGGNVLIASGDYALVQNNTRATLNAALHYAFGTVSGASINWGPTQSMNATSLKCGYYMFGCISNSFGLKYVYAMLNPNGNFAFSYNAYNSTGSTTYDSIGLVYIRGVATYKALITSYLECSSGPRGSVVVPEGDPSNGIVRIVYIAQPSISCSSGLYLNSVTYSSVSNTLGTVDSNLEQSYVDAGHFSVASDAEYNTHLVFDPAPCNGCNPTIQYLYHAAGSSWTTPVGVLQGSLFGNGINPLYPTISVDVSTDTVYVLGLLDVGANPQGSGELFTIVMTTKSPSQDIAWRDSVGTSQIKNRVLSYVTADFNLGSSMTIVSSTNASSIPLTWAEGFTNIGCNGNTGICSGNATIAFATIPVQRVWSPYASPSYPWNGNGLVPNGQYFRNLDEAVSPNTGSLTISQTDFSVPGRGLNLEITRIFGGTSRAPIGIGWGLNFPLYDGTNNAVYLWNGESYKLPVSWLNGCYPHCAWENHQGEYFRLVQNSDYTIDLITKTGIVYHFDNTGNYLLLRVTDPTGNNSENFNYNGLTISAITDTVGRIFLFCYNSFNYLASIDQVSSGTCSSETGFVRRVSYSY